MRNKFGRLRMIEGIQITADALLFTGNLLSEYRLPNIRTLPVAVNGLSALVMFLINPI